jgi:hypothetical protein
MMLQSLREQLRRILERFELECISRGIEQEHCRLLADLATETNAGFDNEADSGITQACRERMPLGPIKHDAEVRHRHIFSIDLVEAQWLSARIKMRDELMPEEIEVDPILRATPFWTCEAPSIEAPRGAQVVYGYRQMKGCRHRATMDRALPR